MKKAPGSFGSHPQENIIPILPAIIAGMLNLIITVAATLLIQPDLSLIHRGILIVYAIAGCGYIGIYYWIYTTLPNKAIYTWINAIIAGTALGLFIDFIPPELDYLVHSLVFIASLSSAVVSDRAPSFLLIAIVAFFHAVHHVLHQTPLITWVVHGVLIVAALVIVETVLQVKTLAKNQINRLEMVNEISKQIVSTLETSQLISLLNTALHNALETDTYYIGIQENDSLQMQLFYDDGEYYPDIKYKLEGSLSGWVIKHQKPLFLPDLRKPLNLEGIDMVVIGKQQPSLSWMGIPMTGSHVKGIIAVASYRPNAFSRADFEMLNNIAQRAALALDNTYHHALVEEQARLDSLTRVLNHGYFIRTLREQAETCRNLNQPLSLIMLDIDFFKQYNDSFGHTIGDEVLVNLCDIIRSHIKQSDAVGRWGGEEFAISLPNATPGQARQVAQRIRGTLAEFKMNSDSHSPIPIPTISMGIAVFPDETDDVQKLIDFADHRLYIAKERGRDQIEAAPTS